MKKESVRLTTAQFAKLHHVNRRTLHYYDHIGLFSPKCKGDNGYRYYDYSQGMEFEYIRMLKEINLSLDEIKKVVYSSNEQEFLQTVIIKQKEIDAEIRKLKEIKVVLSQKQEHLLLCGRIKDMDIQVTELRQECLLTVPYQFEEEDDVMNLFACIQDIWPPEQYRAGVGSYISLDKVKEERFEEYDGLYSPAMKGENCDGILIKPRGLYLCGYIKGSWNRLPELYKKMLDYAGTKGLELTGCAFEMMINDFTISNEQDYITRVSIKITDNSRRYIP